MSEPSQAASLEPLFFPDSVAFIGVSERNPWFIEFFVEMDFDGGLYPVNPNADTVCGYDAYADIGDVPETVDLAIIATPRTLVPEILEDCEEAGVRFVHVFTGGFSEATDDLGQELSAQLTEIVERSRLRVVGPNCIGVFSPGGRVPFDERLLPEPGPIGISSQSGGVATDLCRTGQPFGLRFSSVITLGNMIDVSHIDVLSYLYEDDATEVVVTYVEGVRSPAEGRRLFELFDEHASEKPTLALKGGRNEAGARAARSHTSALAGDYEIWRGVFEQTGVIEVADFRELRNTAIAAQFWDPPRSRNVGIVGHGGGLSVTATDRAAEVGLQTPTLSEETIDRLGELDFAAEIATVKNPVDVPGVFADLGGSGDSTEALVSDALSTIARDDGIDTLLVYLSLRAIHGFGPGEPHLHEILDGIVEATERSSADAQFGVVLWSTGEPPIEEMGRGGREKIHEHDIPVFEDLDGALCGLSNYATFGR